jgi:hypothetical protein
VGSDPSIGACIRIFVWELPDDHDRVVWVGQVHISVYHRINSRPTPAHFSENMGYVFLSPILGGNIFSIMFGRYLDAHAPKQDPRSSSLTSLVSRELPSEHQCFDGKTCYLGSLQVTLVACIVSLGLSWWAGIRDGQKVKARHASVGG